MRRVHQNIDFFEVAGQVADAAEEGNFVFDAQTFGLGFEVVHFFADACNVEAYRHTAVNHFLENVQHQVHGADGVQTGKRAQLDIVFDCFFRNVIRFVQGVVSVGDAVGRETVTDEFFAFVFAVADDVHAQLVEKLGNFRISFRIKAARVVEHFGFRRSELGRNGAGRNDTRHLAVNHIRFLFFQQFHVGKHAFDVTQKTALVKINRLPTDAQCLRFLNQRAV